MTDSNAKLQKVLNKTLQDFFRGRFEFLQINIYLYYVKLTTLVPEKMKNSFEKNIQKIFGEIKQFVYKSCHKV